MSIFSCFPFQSWVQEGHPAMVTLHRKQYGSRFNQVSFPFDPFLRSRDLYTSKKSTDTATYPGVIKCFIFLCCEGNEQKFGGFPLRVTSHQRSWDKWKATCAYQWHLQTPTMGWWLASKSKCTQITCWSFYRCLSNQCEQLIFHIFITPSGVELWLLKWNSNNCVSFQSIIYGMLVCVDTLL